MKRPFALMLLALSACAQRAPTETSQTRPTDAVPSLSFTHWTDRTELFVELPALVRGRPSPFAAHVTRLADFSALSAGRVGVVLRGGGAEERFVADAPTVPGIFRPVALPATAGVRQLSIEVDGVGGPVVHELGEVTVFASVEEARRGVPDEPETPGRITFLKEQQWQTAFQTEAVREREMQPSIPATGALRARSDGEVVITAPVAGRVVQTGEHFPIIGGRLLREAPLALLVPRLEASDRVSLDLAATSARLDLARATQERTRLDALRREGAIPSQRVVEATHVEEEARAALAAAERRRAQFRSVEQTRGLGAVGSVQVRSPLAGVIVEVTVAPGAFVEAGAALFRVADLTSLWLEARVPELDAATIPSLRGAWFTLLGSDVPRTLGAEALLGSDRRVDPVTRTVTVMFAVENRDERLPLGAFVRARLLVGDAARTLTVPTGAVVDDGSERVVFVQREGESFERRVVRLGAVDRSYVAVHAGLRAGERVVTRGAWSVKLAGSGGAVPAHGHAH